MGEHKGYALAFACELLAGAIVGGGTLTPENQGSGDRSPTACWPSSSIPTRLADQAWLAPRSRRSPAYVTASPPRDAEEPVLIPGDPERQMRARRLVEGIPVDDVTWAQIAEAARASASI